MPYFSCYFVPSRRPYFISHSIYSHVHALSSWAYHYNQRVFSSKPSSLWITERVSSSPIPWTLYLPVLSFSISSLSPLALYLSELSSSLNSISLWTLSLYLSLWTLHLPEFSISLSSLSPWILYLRLPSNGSLWQCMATLASESLCLS